MCGPIGTPCSASLSPPATLVSAHQIPAPRVSSSAMRTTPRASGESCILGAASLLHRPPLHPALDMSCALIFVQSPMPLLIVSGVYRDAPTVPPCPGTPAQGEGSSGGGVPAAAIAVPLAVGIPALLLATLWFVVWRRRRRQRAAEEKRRLEEAQPPGGRIVRSCPHAIALRYRSNCLFRSSNHETTNCRSHA